MARDISKYVVQGLAVPSVTEVLTLAGLSDFSQVAPDVLEEARGRGIECHAWLELLDEDLLGDEIPDERIAGYVAGYRKFREETDFEPELIERTVVSESYRYAGTLDRTGKLNGKRALLDIKAVYRVGPSTALQTQGYALCLNDLHERYALQLYQNGTYQLHHYADRNDVHDWFSALRIAHYKLRTGMATLEDLRR